MHGVGNRRLSIHKKHFKHFSQTTMTIENTLEKITQFVIKETNRYIAEEFRIYGKTLQQLKETMNTADFTKLFQYIVNEVIESSLTTLQIEGHREEVTGYDFVIEGHKIEFKLMGGGKAGSFATGNKTSHFGGAKTNLVWAIKYVFSDNQISEFGMVLIDTNRTKSNVWKSSDGRKDSFSALELMVGEEDCILTQIGVVKAATKKLHFLPLPTEVALAA
jgi:hypothetical protein